MSITECPGHMRSLKLNFSATVLNMGLKAKILRLLLSESFGWNCARATRLTAVWTGYDHSVTAEINTVRYVRVHAGVHVVGGYENQQ